MVRPTMGKGAATIVARGIPSFSAGVGAINKLPLFVTNSRSKEILCACVANRNWGSRELPREAIPLESTNAETRLLQYGLSLAHRIATCQIIFVCCTKYDPCIEKISPPIIELVKTVFDVLLKSTIYFHGEHHDIKKNATESSIYRLY